MYCKSFTANILCFEIQKSFVLHGHFKIQKPVDKKKFIRKNNFVKNNSASYQTSKLCIR